MHTPNLIAIELFHGRESPDDDLEDWGHRGPVFLARYVHGTYHHDLKLGTPESGQDGELRYVDDLLYYDGYFYGDWSVFPQALLERAPDLAARVEVFDHRKAVLPQLRRLAR